MPHIYFSAKHQNEENFPGGGNEKYYLDLIVSEITSCINSNAINYTVVDPDFENLPKTNDTDSVFIALKMNHQENTYMGENPGITVSFVEGNPDSKRLAQIILRKMEKIYYDPSKVTLSSFAQPENSQETSLPIVTIDLNILLNNENLEWLRANTEEISQEAIMALDEYFGLPFVPCGNIKAGMAKTDETLRKRPNLDAEVSGSVNAGGKVTVMGQWEDWYVVKSNGDLGYIQTKFIES